MWLINTRTLELHEFIDHKSAPRYAILSHCWGQDEVSFKEYRKGRNCTGPGYQKIVDACRRTAMGEWMDLAELEAPTPRGGWEWLWVDTCCIDKRSSSELSEAINSMYVWYGAADVCFAYLADVDMRVRDGMEQFRQSRWFTRGWTLQELIAPSQVVFFDKYWQKIGVKVNDDISSNQQLPILADMIEEITGVPKNLLRKTADPEDYSVAQRMSWASSRSTTREEDLAYCLFGLFGLNMPLLYGEGSRAFFRLQHEILRHDLGESLLAWRPSERHPGMISGEFFASSPADFAGSADVIDIGRKSGPIFSSRGQWVELRVPHPPQRVVYEHAHPSSSSSPQTIVRLACVRPKESWTAALLTPCVVQLKAVPNSQFLLRHRPPGSQHHLDEDDIKSAESYVPVSGAGTRFILTQSGAGDRWRRANFIPDIEETRESSAVRQRDVSWWYIPIKLSLSLGGAETVPLNVPGGEQTIEQGMSDSRIEVNAGQRTASGR